MVKKLEPGLTAAFTTRPWLSFGLPTVHPIMPTRGPVRAEQTAVERREVEKRMDWKTLLAYITGTVDQELL
jgi:hypothetical protein